MVARKPGIRSRPLLSENQAAELEATFKTLASGTRLRILHALVRGPDTTVGELAGLLGLSIQSVSNHLQRMSERGILAVRRNGNRMHYRVVDPCIPRLLEHGVCLTEDSPIRREARR